MRGDERVEQSMVESDGITARGIKAILEERSLFRKGLRLQCRRAADHSPDNNCCARKLLGSQPDFVDAQFRCAIVEAAQSVGTRALFLPKFHPELNPIENCWGYSKQWTRQNCDYSIKGLRENVPESLSRIPLKFIRKYFRMAFRYMSAYKEGLNLDLAQYAVKKYKSHRCVPSGIRAIQESESSSDDQERDQRDEKYEALEAHAEPGSDAGKEVIYVESDDEEEVRLEVMGSLVAGIKIDENDWEILNREAMLNDALIVSYCNLLSASYPHVQGFQDTTCRKFKLCVRRGLVVQAVHTGSLHWVLLVRNHQSETFFICSMGSQPNERCRDRAKELFGEAEPLRIVRLSQRQQDSVSCGLFVLAFATEICARGSFDESELTNCVFDVSRMRIHLKNCLLAHQSLPFPSVDLN